MLFKVQSKIESRNFSAGTWRNKYSACLWMSDTRLNINTIENHLTNTIILRLHWFDWLNECTRAGFIADSAGWFNYKVKVTASGE